MHAANRHACNKLQYTNLLTCAGVLSEAFAGVLLAALGLAMASCKLILQSPSDGVGGAPSQRFV